MGIKLPKFKVGKTVATPGAIEALAGHTDLEGFHRDIVVSNETQKFLKRHITGDWGDVCKEDAQSNEDAIAHEGTDEQQRVMSVYYTENKTKIWVITEWDRSLTTFLLPSEY